MQFRRDPSGLPDSLFAGNAAPGRTQFSASKPLLIWVTFLSARYWTENKELSCCVASFFFMFQLHFPIRQWNARKVIFRNALVAMPQMCTDNTWWWGREAQGSAWRESCYPKHCSKLAYWMQARFENAHTRPKQNCQEFCLTLVSYKVPIVS